MAFLCKPFTGMDLNLGRMEQITSNGLTRTGTVEFFLNVSLNL